MCADGVCKRCVGDFLHHAENRNASVQKRFHPRGKLRRRAFHPPDLVHENQPRLLRIFERLHACRLKRLREFFDAAPAAFADADAVEIAHRGRFLRRRKQIDGHRARSGTETLRKPPGRSIFSAASVLFMIVLFPTCTSPVKNMCMLYPFLAFSVPASCARQRISSAAIEMAISSGVSAKIVMPIGAWMRESSASSTPLSIKY